MARSHQGSSETADNDRSVDRLDSWKEIALYLGRDVRTVSRWEQAENLPVHRLVHGRQATVYAYRSEINAWLEDRSGQPNGKPLSRRGKIFFAAVLVVGISLGWWAIRGPSGVSDPLLVDLSETARPDRVLVVFEDESVEAAFDDLDGRLEREISNSGAVRVISRKQIQDTLRQMRRPEDTNLTVDLAREVCERDAGVRALLAGSLERQGSAYLLNFQLIEPSEGVTVASTSLKAAGQSKVLSVVGDLSAWVTRAVRENLESLPEPDGPGPFQQGIFHVTTDSVEALRLYRRAIAFNPDDPPRHALLQRAVDMDPAFASAHIHLAHTLRNRGKGAEEFLPPARRAVELVGEVTDRERFYILGSYRHLRKEFREAARYYTSLLATAPDHYWGTSNLARCYEMLGPPQMIPIVWARRADALPYDLRAQMQASRSFAFTRGDLVRASLYNQRAVELLSFGPYGGPELGALAFATFEKWAEGDPDGVLQEMDLLEQLLTETQPTLNFWHRLALRLHLALGRLQEAESHRRFVEEERRRLGMPNSSNEVLIAFFRGEGMLGKALERFQISMRQQGRNIAPGLVMMLLVREGLPVEYEEEMQWDEDLPQTQLVRGELALTRGDWAGAIPLLQAGAHDFFERKDNLRPEYFLGIESLARALEAGGDQLGAVEVLEEATRHRQRIRAAFSGNSQGFWMRDRLHLARLYRQAGLEDLAEGIEEELRKLLSQADPDHAILLQL